MFIACGPEKFRYAQDDFALDQNGKPVLSRTLNALVSMTSVDLLQSPLVDTIVSSGTCADFRGSR